MLMITNLFLFIFPAYGFAETKLITAEGSYNMGDGESPMVAEERALLMAKRSAIEQAGTYIESYSKVNNFQLTEDEVKVLASGVMEVTVLDKKRMLNSEGGLNVWVKIQAKVFTDKISDMAGKIKERSVIEQYAKLEEKYAKLHEQYNELKQQLSHTAMPSERQAVVVKIADNERNWLATRWFEAGSDLFLKNQYNEALNAYHKSYVLKKDNAEAVKKIGDCYFQMRKYDTAIEWYQKAVEIDEKYEAAYWNIGIAYEMEKQWYLALRFGYMHIVGTVAGEFNSLDHKPINPNNKDAWFRMGLMYLNDAKKVNDDYIRKQITEKALLSFNKVTELDPASADAWYFKGFIYEWKNDIWEAVECYKTFFMHANSGHPAYNDAKNRLERINAKYGIKN